MTSAWKVYQQKAKQNVLYINLSCRIVLEAAAQSLVFPSSFNRQRCVAPLAVTTRLSLAFLESYVLFSLNFFLVAVPVRERCLFYSLLTAYRLPVHLQAEQLQLEPLVSAQVRQAQA